MNGLGNNWQTVTGREGLAVQLKLKANGKVKCRNLSKCGIVFAKNVSVRFAGHLNPTNSLGRTSLAEHCMKKFSFTVQKFDGKDCVIFAPYGLSGGGKKTAIFMGLGTIGLGVGAAITFPLWGPVAAAGAGVSLVVAGAGTVFVTTTTVVTGGKVLKYGMDTPKSEFSDLECLRQSGIGLLKG